MRPIDADELIVTECGMCDGGCVCFNGKTCLNCNRHNKCQLREAVDGAPTLDVEPVRHGWWKKRKSWDKYVCSECGFEHDEPHNFCPNPHCGAKMDAKEAKG